jgi:hypothetical protein
VICFRDRSYCAGLCAGCDQACDRLLTDNVRAAAERWWGGPDAPIAVRPARTEDEGTAR